MVAILSQLIPIEVRHCDVQHYRQTSPFLKVRVSSDWLIMCLDHLLPAVLIMQQHLKNNNKQETTALQQSENVFDHQSFSAWSSPSQVYLEVARGCRGLGFCKLKLMTDFHHWFHLIFNRQPNIPLVSTDVASPLAVK